MPTLAGPAAVFAAHTAAYFLSCVLRSANASLDATLASTFSLGEAAVGLLSSLPISAGFDPMTQQVRQPWAIVNQLRQVFDIRQLEPGLTQIADDVQLVMLVHPKNLGDQALYALDRVGPRRAQLTALPIAIVGLLVSAWAGGFPLLAVGRVLLGVGFSISLMAALCANRASFPVGSLAGVNGAAVGIGSSGAAFAGAMAGPLGWTGVQLVLAAACAAVLWMIHALPRDAMPRRVSREARPRMRDVVCDPVFLRLAPIAALAQGSYLAYLGYWIHPWLQSVGGYDAFAASIGLSLASLTMVAGHLLTGFGTRRLMRSGRTLEQTAVAGMIALAGTQLALALMPGIASMPLWLVYGFLGAFNIVAFSVLSAALPMTIQGTAVTLLNLMIFTVGFVVQAGLGACVELLNTVGLPASTAHRVSMLVIGLAILALGANWRRRHGGARASAEDPC